MIKKFQDPDSPIYGGMLPETVVTPNSESNYNSANYLDELQEERQRQKGIAKTYFSEAPTINNIINGVTAFLNSVPGIGVSTSDVMGRYAPMIGVAPVDGPADKIGKANKASKLVSKAEDVVNEASSVAKKAVDQVTELVKKRRGRPPLTPEQRAARAQEKAEKASALAKETSKRRGRPPLTPEEKAQRAQERAGQLKNKERIKKEQANEDKKLNNDWRGKYGNKDFNKIKALTDGDMRHLNQGRKYTRRILDDAATDLQNNYSHLDFYKTWSRSRLKQAKNTDPESIARAKEAERQALINFINWKKFGG